MHPTTKRSHCSYPSLRSPHPHLTLCRNPNFDSRFLAFAASSSREMGKKEKRKEAKGRWCSPAVVHKPREEGYHEGVWRKFGADPTKRMGVAMKKAYEVMESYPDALMLQQCKMKYVLLEKDQIVRPNGYAIIRESSYFINSIVTFSKGMR
uniref:Uncharacterized protein n=1 Tax=Ananas comosus var. bracteatus TaxID=296719 RepID=A0A6V7PZH2_ANACO|nr:unnamed protein product [Ananas comosus var. bracteatus]